MKKFIKTSLTVLTVLTTLFNCFSCKSYQEEFTEISPEEAIALIHPGDSLNFKLEQESDYKFINKTLKEYPLYTKAEEEGNVTLPNVEVFEEDTNCSENLNFKYYRITQEIKDKDFYDFAKNRFINNYNLTEEEFTEINSNKFVMTFTDKSRITPLFSTYNEFCNVFFYGPNAEDNPQFISEIPNKSLKINKDKNKIIFTYIVNMDFKYDESSLNDQYTLTHAYLRYNFTLYLK